MKPELQRIKIAEACGIHPFRYLVILCHPDTASSNTWLSGDESSLAGAQKVADDLVSRGRILKEIRKVQNPTLPDYLADLNAMHEAEKVLLPHHYQKVGYEDQITRFKPGCTWPLCAPAAVRAEAILRYLNLWQDEPTTEQIQMNETPTPRTDARIFDCRYISPGGMDKPWHVIDAIYARELERELTAATDKIETLEWSGVHTCGPECQRPLCIVRRERDAATAACAAKDVALKEIRGMKLSTYGDHWSHDKALNPDAVFDICDAALSNPAGQELLKELAELRAWKHEACQVFTTLPLQEIGKVIKAPLGSNICPKILPFITAQSARIAELEEFKWSAELPNEQCLWWWWDGDEDSAPCPVSIMYSGTNNNYFAAMDQHGWNESQDLEDMGGLWCKVREPEVPTREQQEAARKALATKGWETV